jgi:predicted Zn finger-like uncharacterized protein
VVNVVCQGCGQHYRIDDDKIPATGAAYISCPKCKERITIEASGSSLPQTSCEDDDALSSEAREYFEPGTKTALIYCPEPQARGQVERHLKEMDYEVRLLAGRDDMNSRLKYHLYEVVILYQKGPDQEEALSGILSFINSLAMEVRRHLFVSLVYLGGNPFDSFRAFSRGVDLTLSPMDLGRLSDKLTMALEAKQAIYKTYLECKKRVEEDVF